MDPGSNPERVPDSAKFFFSRRPDSLNGARIGGKHRSDTHRDESTPGGVLYTPPAPAAIRASVLTLTVFRAHGRSDSLD